VHYIIVIVSYHILYLDKIYIYIYIIYIYLCIYPLHNDVLQGNVPGLSAHAHRGKVLIIRSYHILYLDMNFLPSQRLVHVRRQRFLRLTFYHVTK
jgi:hypothetical protein